MKQIPIQIRGSDLYTIEMLETIVNSVDGFTISKVASLVIVDLKNETDMKEVITLIESGINVFLTSKNADPQLLVKAMRAGVREFFQQPLNRNEIIAALEKFREQQQQINETDKLGQIITVIGSKGGVGTTTIAVNLAMVLSKTKANSSVCLIDLNLLCGEAHLFLDMEYSYHWGEAIRNIDRLDSTLLMNILNKHKSGVHVLTAPTILTEYRPQTVNQMLLQIQKLFDFVVIDGGPKMNTITLGSFEISNEILLVSNLNILSLASTANLLKGFVNHGFNPKDKVKVVANKHQRSGDITSEQAEKMLDAKIFWALPKDKIAASAINNGQALIDFAPKSHISKAIYSMSEKLFSEDNINTNKKTKRVSLFRR